MSFSPGSVAAGYLVRLKFANGDTEELSGFDSDDFDTAVRWCEVVLRWLRGFTLHAHALPKGTIKGVFKLRKTLKRRGDDPLTVRVEVANAATLAAVWADSDACGEDDPGATVDWTPPTDHSRTDAGSGAKGPHLVKVLAERR